MERSVEIRYEKEGTLYGRCLGQVKVEENVFGKAIGEVNPSTLGKTTSLK